MYASTLIQRVTVALWIVVLRPARMAQRISSSTRRRIKTKISTAMQQLDHRSVITTKLVG